MKNHIKCIKYLIIDALIFLLNYCKIKNKDIICILIKLLFKYREFKENTLNLI